MKGQRVLDVGAKGEGGVGRGKRLPCFQALVLILQTFSHVKSPTEVSQTFCTSSDLFAIWHHARILLKVIIKTRSEFVIRRGGALSQLSRESAEHMHGIN